MKKTAQHSHLPLQHANTTRLQNYQLKAHRMRSGELQAPEGVLTGTEEDQGRSTASGVVGLQHPGEHGGLSSLGWAAGPGGWPSRTVQGQEEAAAMCVQNAGKELCHLGRWENKRQQLSFQPTLFSFFFFVYQFVFVPFQACPPSFLGKPSVLEALAGNRVWKKRDWGTFYGLVSRFPFTHGMVQIPAAGCTTGTTDS